MTASGGQPRAEALASVVIFPPPEVPGGGAGRGCLLVDPILGEELGQVVEELPGLGDALGMRPVGTEQDPFDRTIQAIRWWECSVRSVVDDLSRIS
ncbi:hypothetical protein FDG2_0485 [Candidatus Protofrankia californiensis]|uniref:Uncharacterized protein n=1 Tax=Candidatus Protofrankia californiensis TaxID=1839754 RepID=A0A1C3NTM9_9ACTN|nr:hypothetical protein FDG2_0485 [Candidatus Protofrankia californiensis]